MVHNKELSKNNLRVYNTLEKKVVDFSSLQSGNITIYNCGPTLHRLHTQIGNLRSYTFSDLVKRYFLFLGYNVKHVIKVTDVDDHTVEESLARGIPLREYTDYFYGDYIEQLKTLNIILPTFLPRVTDHITDLVSAIKTLKEKGYTYEVNNSIYFRINKAQNYGVMVTLEKQLALRKNAQGRMEEFLADEKENVNDFCLWKTWTKKDGGVYWETEIGKGRPGWHLECSVLSRKYLGDSIDIHIGGISHIFPHHTNEIAISEAITEKQFVRYWLHHDYLVIDGKKMSKDKGMFYTLSYVLKQNYHPIVLRFMLLKTHYRQKLNFTWAGMDEALYTILKFVKILLWLENVKNNKEEEVNIQTAIQLCREEFKSALNDDFNVSKSFEAIFSFFNFLNKNRDKITVKQAQASVVFIFELDEVLGFIKSYFEYYKERLAKIIANNGLEIVLDKRNIARENGEFEKADEFSQLLLNKGLKITDLKNCNSFFEINE